MKVFALTIIAMIVLSIGLYAQVYDRRYHPEYMWTSFEEDFSGPTLDRSVWEPTIHYRRALGFLVDSIVTVQVNKGNLELKMQHAPQYRDSIWRTSGWETISSDYIGGEVNTKKKFMYGVFECKAKYALKSGSWPAFWLIGGEEIPCPPGGHGGEIDIAELVSASDFPQMMHVIHRYYPPVDCNISNIVNKNMKKYKIPAKPKYFTYKCLWTPEKIQYFIDDKLMHEVINQHYDWFPSFPMRLVLSQQVIQGYDLAQTISPVTPQTSYFDWVKIRQFFLAPEITCPDTITSEAMTTLEVDSLASDFTWQLTPNQLFTTSEGTGKTAQIEKAPDASGPGKITFTFQMPSGEVFTAEKTCQVVPTKRNPGY